MVGIALAAGTAAPLMATAALGAAGFTAAGVVGGSLAAGWQATIGNVVAGSVFSALHSAGAAGVGWWSGAAAGAAAGATGSAAGTGYVTSAATTVSCGWIIYVIPIAVLYMMLSRL